jgi:CheY-like chemotaxis protein
VSIRQSSKRLGLLGSAVIGKQVTDFLDVRAVVQAAAPEWLEGEAGIHGAVVLLAEASPFLRGLLRGELEMAGHCVVEASTTEEALSRMEGRGISVVLAASDLPPNGCGGLQEAMRQQANLAEIPIVALSSTTRDRESMLASIEKLATAVAAPELAVAFAEKESQA